MKIKFFNKLRSFLNKRSDLYSIENFQHVLYFEKKYPVYNSLEKQGIYAYQTKFMLSFERVKDIKNIIGHVFAVELDKISDEGEIKNGGHSITYSIGEEFRSHSMDLVTNSVEFIQNLQTLDLSPSPPWIVFPDIDPEGMGSLQGELEYWWSNYWLPFWHTLSPSEKDIYISKSSVSVEWIDFIRFHDKSLSQ